MNYIAGFCSDGPQCKFMHPQFDLPATPDVNTKDNKKPPIIICHHCGEIGHKISYCLKMSPEAREAAQKQEEAKMKSLGYIKPGGPESNLIDVSENNQNMQNQPQQHHHYQNHNQNNNMAHPRLPPKPLEEVTCFKCGNKGHYANRCPKGHLAFLSQAKKLVP